MINSLSSPEHAAQWLRAAVRGTLRSDSRAVQPGDGFIAWPGYATDGRRYVAAALKAGAAACLVEQLGLADVAVPDAAVPDDRRVAAINDLKRATGDIAAQFHGQPGAALDVIAVTGTNGKSSTAWWTAQALGLLGRRCGLVGTLGIGEPGAVQSTGLTTPDPVTLQGALRGMVDAGFAACAIEASSIGINEHRLAGLPVAVAQFTNFTRDHLDYHGDMAAYWACKRALFDAPGLRAAVINIDDAQGAVLAAELSGLTCIAPSPSQGEGRDGGSGVATQPLPTPDALDVWTVAVHGPARLAAQNVRYVEGGLAFEVIEDGIHHPVRSRLIGDYNASNLLVVLGGLRALGIALADAVGVVPQLTPVPGRMQPVGATAPATTGAHRQPAVVVDYAHTPDALEKALAALRPMATARAGRLLCVFGCGGDRDASKRPLMGAIAQRLADAVVVTSDNPRSEPPEAILAQIVAGMAAASTRAPAPLCIADRAEAIHHTISHAQPADVVLIAGKGHETTQEVAGVKQPFSDVDVSSLSLSARRSA